MGPHQWLALSGSKTFMGSLWRSIMMERTPTRAALAVSSPLLYSQSSSCIRLLSSSISSIENNGLLFNRQLFLMWSNYMCLTTLLILSFKIWPSPFRFTNLSQGKLLLAEMLLQSLLSLQQVEVLEAEDLEGVVQALVLNKGEDNCKILRIFCPC